MSDSFDLIAFDADDTLWHDMRNFRIAQNQFYNIFSGQYEADRVSNRLYSIEKKNLDHFGYGIKKFVLSMIKAAVELSDGDIDGNDVQQIIDIGRDMMERPVELLEGVREVLEQLAADYELMLLSKGDLFAQHRKLDRSGLRSLFSSIEIVIEKDVQTYLNVTRRLNVEPSRFLMVGNSLRSDVLPAIEAGCQAVYVPYPFTWRHEEVPREELQGYKFPCLDRIEELPKLLEANFGRGQAF